MKALGRIIGATLGIPAGIPGVAFGFLVGFLIDKAFENRGQSVRFERFLARPEDTDVDRQSGVLYLGLGLLNEAAVSAAWTTDHDMLLRQAGARGAEEPERRDLLATARARGTFSFRGCLSWARRNMSRDEMVALVTLLLLPEAPGHGAASSQVALARRVADELGLSVDDRRESWERARPLDADAVALLGVQDATDLRELQKAFRLLPSQCHPDSLAVLEEPQRHEASEAFVRIRGAYDRIRPLVGAWFSEETPG